VRLGFLAAIDHGHLTTPDTPAYEQLADAIRSGDGYTSNAYSGFGGFPAGLTRPPGYPAFLAALGSHARDHRVRTAVAQIVVSSVFAVAISLLAAALFSQAVGLAAGAIYALDWATLVHVPLAVADVMFAVPVGLGVLVLALALRSERGPWWMPALGGLLLGVACLMKPAAQILVLGMAVLLLIVRRPWWHALVFVAVAAVVAVPWMARNKDRYDVLTLSPISTANLYFETGLGTTAYESPLHTDVDALGPYLERVDAQWRAKTLAPPERARQLKTLAWRRIRDRPFVVLDQAVIGLGRTALGTGKETIRDEWKDTSTPPSVLTTWGPLLEILIIWALVIAGTVVAWIRRPVPRRVIACLVVGLVLTLVPAAEPGGYARFRTPAAPIMAVLAGFGLVSLWELRGSRRGRTGPDPRASSAG
jgi:4-amino-4-deoxy-L-arabinose transferase-like glycosyltransferase